MRDLLVVAHCLDLQSIVFIGCTKNRLFPFPFQHTIKGKMAFAPMVHRLSCGYTPELPYGKLEFSGIW